MKYTIIILCLVLIGLICIQNDAYIQQKKFVNDCASKGGIYSEAQDGWLTMDIMCNK